MSQDKITLLGHALLGLLAQRPASGYDVRKTFSHTPMGAYSDSPGAIYPALGRLERGGLIRGTIEKSSGMRRRKVFRLTPEGKAAFERWLRLPVRREDVVHGRDELMLRFSFMELTLGAKAARRFLEEFAGALESYIPELREYLVVHAGEMPPSGRLALESGVRSYETLLGWTQDAVETYRKGRKGRTS